MVRLCVLIIAQFAVLATPVRAQWAPYLQIVEDCTAVDESGADYFSLARGSSTTYHGLEEGHVILNPVGDWDKYRRSTNKLDDPRGRIPLKYMVGRPESLGFVKELLNTNPDDPWLLYCLAEARMSVIDSTPTAGNVFWLTDVPPPFSTASEFLTAQIRELHEIRELLTRIERLKLDADAPKAAAFNFVERNYFLFQQGVLSQLMEFESRQQGELIRLALVKPEDSGNYFLKSYVKWIEWHAATFYQNPAYRRDIDPTSQDRISDLLKNRLDQVAIQNKNVSERGEIVELFVHLNRDVFYKRSPEDLRHYLELYSELIADLEYSGWIFERAKLNIQLHEFDAARSDLALFLKNHGHREEYDQLVKLLADAEEK
jgi:hypothetical protein